MKKLFVLVWFSLLVGCGNTSANETDKNLEVLIDVTEYSMVSSSDLVTDLGEPDKIEENYMGGTLYSYTDDLGHFEFILHDDSVTRMTVYSNDYWNNEGENFPYHGIDTVKTIGIEELKPTAKKKDTGSTLIISPVSDNVADVQFHDIEEDEFGMMKITYNLSNY
ncbi:hypothetical protein [Jeotgalibaca porci]|uniref:hypothetical protein n=1 Tax=Jeotgalibaca porci TaxID=1868793 RepID=UPI0035A0ADA2